MTIVIRLGGGMVMAAVPAASPEGRSIYLKLNQEGDTQLPWKTSWQRGSLPAAVKSLLFSVIRYNPFLKKEKEIRLVLGCPVTEEWADSGKRAEMAELIRKATYAAEVRVVWETFPAVLGALGHCAGRALSVYDGIGIFCLEPSYASLIYVRSVRECICAQWRTDSDSWEEADFLRVCMDAGRKMEEQGIMVKDLILTGCETGAAFAEQILGNIFTEARIIRPVEDDFLMLDGLILDGQMEARRGGWIQDVTRSILHVLQYGNGGDDCSLSGLMVNLERNIGLNISSVIKKTESDAAFVKKPQRGEKLGEQVKTHPNYREDGLTWRIGNCLDYWGTRLISHIWSVSYEELGRFVPKRILEELQIPDDFWRKRRHPALFLEQAERDALAEKLKEEIFALELCGWETKLKETIERVLDRMLKERLRKAAESAAAHSLDCILRRYDGCGLNIRPADADDAVFDRLSLQCRMGDVEAMYGMALWHRNRCGAEDIQILDAYEENPDRAKLPYRRPDAILGTSRFAPPGAQYYILWLVRSALYGHEGAKKLLERCGLYWEYSPLPVWIMDPYIEKREKCSYVLFPCYRFHAAGLTDLKYKGEGLNACLYALNRERYYSYSYESDYIPADEGGFGREADYEQVYLDEFFNVLPERRENLPAEIIREELNEIAAKRERYWNSPLHDSRRRGSGN